MNSNEVGRLLVEHTDAWNSHDLARLMDLFTDDCVFDASAGSETCGSRFEGRALVRTAFAAVFESMPDAHWGDAEHFVLADDYGLSQWRLTGTSADGSRVDVLGCDLLTIGEHGIARKNSFRKNRPPITTGR